MNSNTKLFLYMLALLVLQIQTGTADYTAEDVATWKPWDWFKLVIAILGSLALSARMFFDQSVSREQLQELSDLEKRMDLSTTQMPVGTSGAAATKPADTGKT